MRLRACAVAVVPLIAVLTVVALAACTSAGQPASGQHQSARHQHAKASGEQAARQHALHARQSRQVREHHHQRSQEQAQQPRKAAASVPRRHAPVNHCRFNQHAQKAIVSLAVQHMWMCAHHRTVYDTAITSGMLGPYTHTPTGNYWIQGRNRNTTLTLNSGATYDVRYWIPFDAPLFGFHDSSWQKFPYGSPRYRAHGSHGCIHMPLHAIAWFYRWVARTTAVHIF